MGSGPVLLRNHTFYGVFFQGWGRHCLLRQNELKKKELQFDLQIIAREHLNYKMNRPRFIVSNQRQDSNGE